MCKCIRTCTQINLSIILCIYAFAALVVGYSAVAVCAPAVLSRFQSEAPHEVSISNETIAALGNAVYSLDLPYVGTYIHPHSCISMTELNKAEVVMVTLNPARCALLSLQPEIKLFALNLIFNDI